MTETNKYKIEKLGMHWHILQLHYVELWTFKKYYWLTEYPYYWFKKDAEKALEEILNMKSKK